MRNPTIEEVEAKCREVLKETGLQELIVQEFIDGPEVYTPVFRLGGDFFVFHPAEIFVEEDEWTQGTPIGIELNRKQKHAFRRLTNEKLEAEIGALAAHAMEELEIDIVSRMDFRIDKSGAPKLFDMAEVPGLSEDHAIGQSLAFAKAPFDGWELMLALNIIRALQDNPSLEASARGG